MRRHLTPGEAEAALRRGASIQQFLGFADLEDGRDTFWYLEISPRRDEIAVYAQHVFDEGHETFGDVGEFSPVKEWDPFDELVLPDDFTRDPSVTVFSTAGEALAHTLIQLGARPDRWVNSGLIDDEYTDARHTRTAPQP